ncbi:MAG: hypothetical protein JXC36_06550 [Candidatus Atribacteria bacterium]|nr:hypothetical protein [Candidatus Atribacteria bacterium]
MDKKRILYISGSLGLGHITRDLAIAIELRRQNPNIEISWLAAHPASQFVVDSGEYLLPEAVNYGNDNDPAEKAAKGSQLNLLKYLFGAREIWARNVSIFTKVTERNHFDLVIGDETYEIAVGMQRNFRIKKAPFVMIFDFIGLDAMTGSLLEKFGIYIWNRIWSAVDYNKKYNRVLDMGLFVGEEEDVPNRSFGFLLPNRREWAKTLCQFIGYIIPFNPLDYSEKEEVRKELGYGPQPLIICSVGGTSVGKDLLNLCAKAYPIVKEHKPDLRMILVCGPRLSPESLEVPQGVEVRKYIPDLFKHFAVADLVIVLGGATSTLELSALKQPFLYFPLEGHCEQALVAERLSRHKAGVKMIFSQTSPVYLAEKILHHMGEKVEYLPIPLNGAQKAATLISQLL